MSRKKRVKLTCAFLFITAIAAVLFTNNQAIETVGANSSGPPAGNTGAPGELTCATAGGCHGGTTTNNSQRFRIEAPATYEPGQTYQITVRHVSSGSGRRRWGFQLTALTSSNSRAGELQSGSSPTHVLSNDGPGGNRQYIEHSFDGTFSGVTTGASWTFNWEAPSTAVGPVTLYAAGNQANGDQNNTGDQIYVATATITAPVAPSKKPKVMSANVSGKKLIVMGEDFEEGADILLDGQKQKKTSNDESNPSMILVAKKSGKKVPSGQPVTLHVRNLDGTMSDPFTFTRP